MVVVPVVARGGKIFFSWFTFETGGGVVVGGWKKKIPKKNGIFFRLFGIFFAIFSGVWGGVFGAGKKNSTHILEFFSQPRGCLFFARSTKKNFFLVVFARSAKIFSTFFLEFFVQNCEKNSSLHLREGGVVFFGPKKKIPIFR